MAERIQRIEWKAEGNVGQHWERNLPCVSEVVKATSERFDHRGCVSISASTPRHATLADAQQ